MAANLIPLGRSEEAIRMLEITLRRDPLNGWNYDRYADMGWALLLLGRDDEAMTWLQRALAASPIAYPVVHAWIGIRLAAAYARLGHFDQAHSALAETNRIWPTIRCGVTHPDIRPNQTPYTPRKSNNTKQHCVLPGFETMRTKMQISAYRRMAACTPLSLDLPRRLYLRPRRYTPSSSKGCSASKNRSSSIQCHIRGVARFLVRSA